ncbi:Glycine--tRNA ligase 1 [Hibiscus syriacus]|uniref:Glycine--tRNA ligase 1 n=1 Tax=Hibiscus syriacus TaxID=106335 RepID=A0A6A3CD68_HIBSY|nr:Glycine--tRNA ligase 1 [Hibiscus syriacus]
MSRWPSWSKAPVSGTGPKGHGFMRSETAQGIFVNFKDLYYYNGRISPLLPLHKLARRLEMREKQVSGQPAESTCLGEAASKGIVNNETLGYFIGRVHLFLTYLGIDKDQLRFRQHLANEMAHYPADCWDAEIECSYGWIECVGFADRSAYDLRAHTDKSGVPLAAHEKFAEPREVENLVIAPVKKELALHSRVTKEWFM